MTLDRRTTQRRMASIPRVIRAVITACVVLTLAGVPTAASTPRDGTFGTHGIARVDFGGADRAVSGFLLPSGKYLLVGQSETAAGTVRIALARLGADGDLDPTFADAGRALLAPFDIGGVEAAARKPDGRVVVLVHDTADHHALVGVQPDGSLDRSFGDDGVVRTTSRSFGWGSILALPNGKVLVATDDLARYTTDGAIDASFGRNGRVQVEAFGASLMREDGGHILVFGAGGASVHGRRYDAQGRRDRSFGRAIDSIAFVSVYPRYFLTGIPMVGAISARGRIFLGSLAGNDGQRKELDGLAVAFTRKGKPARGFHRDGWRSVDFGGREWFSGIVALPDGRVLLSGARSPRRRAPADAIVLTTLNPDGSLRHRFGNRGKAFIKATPGRQAPQAFDLFADGDRALVVGEGGGDFLLARYRLDA